MQATRRTFLAGSVAVASLAGCLGDSDESTDGNPADEPGGGGNGTEGSLELAFGDGGVFTDEDSIELVVEISNPRLRTTVPVVGDGNDIYVDSPESSEYFIFADVALRNDGSAPIDPPSGLYFETDGEEVDRAAIRTPGRKYRDIGELAPGDDATGTIAFPAPAEAETATITLRFQGLLDSEPAHWSTDYADLERSSTDLSRDGIGESITIEADEYAYEFTPTEARTTTSYTYGDGKKHAASDGSTFLLLSARSETVGEKPVKLPTPYEITIVADGSEIRSDQFEREDERYEGRVDPTAAGEDISGTLLYEIPASTSSVTVRLAVGNQTFATWPVDLE